MYLSRRIVLGGAATAVGLLLTSCGQNSAENAGGAASASSSNTSGSGSVSIKHAQGTTEVPKNPKKVFTFDFGVLNSLQALGLDVQGVPEVQWPEDLAKYKDSKYTKVGGSKEPDFEKIATEKPDLIIISARAAKAYPELSKIAPTIDLSVDPKRMWASFVEHTQALGAIFGKEAEAKAKIAELESLSASVAKEAKGKGTALFLMVSGGTVTAFGKNSRFGLLYEPLGLTPVAGLDTDDRHGQAVSFELIKEKNPDRLYVLDRDQAVGQSKPGQSAKEVLNNPLVASTKAARSGKIAYVNPARWYLVGYGLENLEVMIGDVRSNL